MYKCMCVCMYVCIYVYKYIYIYIYIDTNSTEIDKLSGFEVAIERLHSTILAVKFQKDLFGNA